MKSKTIRSASKLDALRRDLYVNDYNEREDVDFQHVVASLPELLVDSDEPVKHAYKILKVLLETKWGIKGFLAIYHPYRIKDEYRKDQYDHGGAEGQGDMTWADVLSSENPEEYIKFEPHFHLFFPSRRYAFDYSVVEAVERQSGWVFNRIEKKEDDDHRSVANLDDLVHQICYCYSHAGVHERESRNELTSVMKGRLHNISVLDDGTEEQVTASFCDAAPKLLGVRFSNVNESNCEAEQCDCDGECECEDDHPLHELYNQWDDGTTGLDNSAASSSAAPSFDESSPSIDDTSASHSLDGNTQASDQDSSSDSPTTSSRSVPNPVVTDRDACGGDLIPIREAGGLLDDGEWCKQARYSAALQLAFEEWEDRVDSDDSDEPHPGEAAVQRR
ncbi:hypothetical protein DP106_14785 [Halonotius pteroides]|uniref:Uncharacterized protein n=1 Tax=Halonotius pteroides TaxID=268735 RepID=A0A3A6Q7N9_9EURY|nr:hypothetical protein DP106_14785 [Halonotius pteroides]